MTGDVGDEPTRGDGKQAAPTFAVVGSRTVHRGRVFTVAVDQVRMPGGEVKDRDVVHHPGAVGVVALRGEPTREEVLLLRQYRSAVGRHLLELPAGILDVEAEPASRAAARELAEEAGLRAGDWAVLVDAFSTPGMSDEAVRVFLAREVSEDPDIGFTRVDEEADLQTRWLPLDEAVAMVARGEVTNALCVMGLLAADRSRRDGWSGLRPLSASWPGRPAHEG